MKPLFKSPTGGPTLGPVPGSEFHNDRGDHLHGGIDLNCVCGSTVYAPKRGTVIFVGASSGLGGNKVEIDHGVLVDGKPHITKHYHFGPKGSNWGDVIYVRVGDHVSRGQPIGVGGMSGNATACHDHYEHWVDGRPVDPLQYLGCYQVIRRRWRMMWLALAYPGSVGPDIPFLQKRLLAHGFNPGPVDGIWGDRTTWALKRFQRDKGLTVDAILGRQSWQALLKTP